MTIKKQKDIDKALSGYRKALSPSEQDRTTLTDARKEIRACLRANFTKVKFLTQGSFRYRTLNRPCYPPTRKDQPGQQMDLDYGIYFPESVVVSMGLSAAGLLSRVADSLSDLSEKNEWILSSSKPSCVRVIISNDKHVDIPVYRVSDTEIEKVSENVRPDNDRHTEIYNMLEIPYLPKVATVKMAHREDGWKNSDPRQIIDWVINCIDQHGKQYLHICRILKGWRDHQWREKSPLSSILIMAMVEAAMKKANISISEKIDNALFEVVRDIPEVLKAGIIDPDNSTVNKFLSSELTLTQKSDCENKFKELFMVLSNVMYGQDRDDWVKILKNVFGKFFPSDSSLIQKCVVAAVTTVTTQAAAKPLRPYATTDHSGSIPTEFMTAKDLYRKFSSDEIRWIEENHPTLSVQEEGRLLRGLLWFRAQYEDNKKQNLIFEDEYQVDIRIGNDNIPHVWETGRYLQSRAYQLGKPLIDMHVYPYTKEICMGTAVGIQRMLSYDDSIQGMFNNLIIRYFYYHTYWRKQKREPWPGLGHGDIGVLQEYLDNRESANPLDYWSMLSDDCRSRRIYNGKVKKNILCLCGRGKVKKCTCGVMGGLESLIGDCLSRDIINYARSKLNM